MTHHTRCSPANHDLAQRSSDMAMMPGPSGHRWRAVRRAAKYRPKLKNKIEVLTCAGRLRSQVAAIWWWIRRE